MKLFLGLIHRGECQGMVAPCLIETLTEAELRGLVQDAMCFRCAEDVPDNDLEAEYVEVADEAR